MYRYYRLEHGHSRPAEFFCCGRYTPPFITEDGLEEVRASNPDRGVYVLTLRDVLEREGLEGDVFLDENYVGKMLFL